MLERLSMRKHLVGREIPCFAKVNVNKVDCFYGIVLIKLACCYFRYTPPSLCCQCVYVHSVTAAQNELN